MRFEWDESKNRSNQRNHRLSFETAAEVFDDPLHLSRPPEALEGEMRWRTIDQVGGLVLIVVVHTYRDDDGGEIVQIISARAASKHEGANMRTARQRAAELKKLAALRDEDIDFSDVPEHRDWSGAEVGKFYRPVKTQITLRIDADVLAWFKAQGGKYQTAVNAALREHIARNSKGRR